MIEITSYETFCKAFVGTSVEKDRANLLLYLQNWIIDAMVNNNQYIDKGLDEFSSRGMKNEVVQRNDALSFITNSVEDKCKHIFFNMREKIIRENTLVPIYKVKEMNSYGLQWLSKRPGRTIKEKMASSNSMMSVKRRMSFDTGENRLFLAFVKQLHALLEIKIDYMPKEYINRYEIDFYQFLSKMVYAEELSEIKNWDNLPPNNTLLTNSSYKTIWSGWNELKELDAFIKNCNVHIEQCISTVFYIELIILCKKFFSMPQVPIKIEYNNFLVHIDEPLFVGIDNKGNYINLTHEENTINVGYRDNYVEIYFKEDWIYIKKNNELLEEQRFCAEDISIYLLKVAEALVFPQQQFEKENLTSTVSSKKHRNVIIDLFSVRPKYIADNKFISVLSERLLQQQINDIHSNKIKYTLSCGSSDALLIQDKNYGIEQRTNTYSILSAINDNSREQMKMLILMLRRNIVTDQLTFLFPDVFNEFQLSLIHKASRSVYKKVQAFPKSISAAFEFQDSQTFTNQFQPEDFLLVVNLVDDEITLTLIKGVFDEEIYQHIPQYKGILWERHPTFSVSCKEAMEQLEDKLIKQGCEMPELLYKTLGRDGIKEEKNQLTCVFSKNSSMKITNQVIEAIDQISIPITDIVSRFLLSRKQTIQGSKVHILALSDVFRFKGINTYQLYTDDDALNGYLKYQKIKKDIVKPLWRDHLPDLAIKRLYGKFDLVNQATVLPSFNTIQEIKVDNTFILPKGQKFYCFQLIQNDLNSKIQYEAVVKHAVFPLKQDVECKLRMTYRYGAEEPYELLFVPLDKKQAGFIEAKVEWKPITSYPYENLVYPEFPSLKSWEELMHYPATDGERHNDLVEWIISSFRDIESGYQTEELQSIGIDFNQMKNYEVKTIEKIVDGKKSLITFTKNSIKNKDELIDYNNYKGWISFELKKSDRLAKRYYVDFEEEGWNGSWENIGRGYFIFKTLTIDGEDIRVSFFEDNFTDRSQFDPSLSCISFELKEAKDNKYRAVHIEPGYLYDFPRYDAIDVRKGNRVKDSIVSNGRMFAMHRVFFGGRSVNDEDCPAKLKKQFDSCIESWLIAYKQCTNTMIRNKLFNMMSLMAKDIGAPYYEIAHEMIERYQNGQAKLNDSIGYALGEYTTEEQRNLLDAILKIKQSKVICLFSKAAWKNSQFISNVPAKILIQYFEYAIDGLDELYNELEIENGGSKKQILVDIVMYIEYILAVFRLREKKQEELCKRLSMNNPKVRKLYTIIEKIIDKDIPIRSHLNLEVNKKGIWKDYAISDLLFVALVYITGDSGESDIKISGINSEE